MASQLFPVTYGDIAKCMVTDLDALFSKSLCSAVLANDAPADEQ
jgi:hypothetical protein